MLTFYLILVIVLFILAISDLIVGVSNDAVNFLNSAVGSKASSFKVILFVAALGILAGATFSSGMMEVARKGIFHPQYFYFSEIILLFLAVMVTDVILLDVFNTFGMPTSTTVSIVFELLGAAVAFSLIKIYTDPNAVSLGEYINSGKALAIIAGILLSVVVAFSAGVIIQYLSRLLFSFDYQDKLKYFGGLWGGMAIAAITYFMLIKGAKGASFMSGDIVKSISENSFKIILISFAGWAIILQLLIWFTKVDILKVIVLVGTFALAMAFAGNDLVNFIGVPLAGYNSYQMYIESGAAANNFLMNGLAGKVPTPTLLLLIAGLNYGYNFVDIQKSTIRSSDIP
jgi:phosphate/sulfate permease